MGRLVGLPGLGEVEGPAPGVVKAGRTFEEEDAVTSL